MNKLLIVSASFLFVVGSISITWAHGPKASSSSGYRSSGHSKPHFSKPSHMRSGRGHQHRGSVSPQSRRLPRIEHGVIHSKPGPLQNKPFYSPLTKSYNQGFGVSPLRKALERKGVQQVLRHSHSPHPSYFDKNPDPWFLYGKGDKFRQMGLIPPRRKDSQGLR